MLEVNITSFSYGKQEVLSGVSFDLQPGQHLAVLGESGCGKSTLLHLIYGLLDLDEGTISWNGKTILGPKFNLIPGEDYIKLVAQEFNVMPYTTVAENVATFLSRRDLDRDKERVEELLWVVGLEDFAEKKVKTLSGGQKQRVAIAKALAKSPELLLLDEPFSNIDTFRKNKLRRKLYGYLKENKISCITATHDSEEALSFAQELLILKNGSLEAHGPTKDVYHQLNNEYRAGFFGDVNVLPATVVQGVAETKGEVYLLPHQLSVTEEQTALQVTVRKAFFKGSHYLIESLWNEKIIYFSHSEELPLESTHYLESRLK